MKATVGEKLLCIPAPDAGGFIFMDLATARRLHIDPALHQVVEVVEDPPVTIRSPAPRGNPTLPRSHH